jgi:hypothetical protein
MMTKIRITALAAGLTLALFLSNSVLADVTVTYYFGKAWTSKMVYKSDANADIRLDCRDAKPCTQCGSCHTTEPQDAMLKKLTQISWDKHLSSYFPRQTYSLSEDQKLTWSQDGDYYVNRKNQLAKYDRAGTLIWTAPADSRILKDARGKPFAVLLNRTPSNNK